MSMMKGALLRVFVSPHAKSCKNIFSKNKSSHDSVCQGWQEISGSDGLELQKVDTYSQNEQSTRRRYGVQNFGVLKK